MNAADVVAIQHDGELVCEDCLANDAERAVFKGTPDCFAIQDADGSLGPVFADQVEIGETCGRCGEYLPGCEPEGEGHYADVNDYPGDLTAEG